METNTEKAGSKRAYISAIVVLLLLNTASIYMLFNEKDKGEDLSIQKTALERDFRMLNDTLDNRNTSIEQFVGKNAELDKTIASKQEEISHQKLTIQSLLKKVRLTQTELKKVKVLMAQYKNSVADMGNQIATLTKQKEELLAQNGQLNNALTAEKQTTSQLMEKNTSLSKKVEIGSLLPIAKIDVEAVKTRKSGREVDVRRAKVASNLKISFETGENKVLDPGPVSLYVRIINPKGETIAVEDQGSGIMHTGASAEPIPYTKKADIDYDQSNKKVVVYWGKYIQNPGTYKVELYQNGYVIGQGEVKLS